MKFKLSKSTFFLVGIILLFLSCKSSESIIDYPSCIAEKIQELKKSEIQNPPAQVWKWEVNGLTYYYITSDCCDQFNYLYDEDCNVVCAPDGGFTGNGDGNCPEFTSEIVRTLLWEDLRK
jgi:hypothetical protein